MNTSKQVLTLIVIFHYHLVSWFKLEIHAFGGPSDFSVGYHQTIKGLHTETVQTDPIKFCHLK